MTEETTKQIAEISGTICAILLIIFAVLFCLYMIIYAIKTEKMQQDYIKQLNEHDKSVIMDYKNCHFTLKNKKNKNNEKI